ncbi:MAG: AAA family ATPase, partial [Candidatus Rokubacteria bacterium]|nr:AAA family ATPase [Candidatus Rokubacteria bacterium]
MYVVTFYSFKGGVGRSLAAANIAVSLADAGLQVLLVDFDLEAPGLTYLPALAPRRGERRGGVAELIADSWEAKQTQDPKNYLYHPEGFEGRLAVMPAGAVGTPAFPKAFSRMREFFGAAFDKKQGAPGLTLFRDLRRAWELLRFDYVVIDSRTGLTDIGGVCTRLLPDLVVLFLGLGEQGLDGIKQVLDQVGQETLYGDRLEVRLVAAMLPEGEEALLEERLIHVEHVLGRRPDFFFPIFPPLFLKEDARHIEHPRSTLAQEYQKLRDAIREANRWDAGFRLSRARLRVAEADVEPLAELVRDLLSSEADELPSQSRWEALSDAAVALLQAPARSIEAKLRAVGLGTSALREILARLDRYQYRDLYGSTLNNLANALRELPARDAEERAGSVKEAVGYYKEALGVYTRDRYPVEWAGTRNNLAGALTELPARDEEERAGSVKEAVGYYK